MQNSLNNRKVQNVLERLHAHARKDLLKFVILAPRAAIGLLMGKTLTQAVTPRMMKDFYIPVSREVGQFLYMTARSTGARRIIEFGTSFGISTIYLASAVRDNGGGIVIGTELESSKHEIAKQNILEAGLDDMVDIRLGDALETLKDVDYPVDMAFIDGWKDLYLPILELIKPKLRPCALVLADNIIQFKRSLRPYVNHVQSGKNGFTSVTLNISDGIEYSCCMG